MVKRKIKPLIGSVVQSDSNNLIRNSSESNKISIGTLLDSGSDSENEEIRITKRPRTKTTNMSDSCSGSSSESSDDSSSESSSGSSSESSSGSSSDSSSDEECDTIEKVLNRQSQNLPVVLPYNQQQEVIIDKSVSGDEKYKTPITSSFNTNTIMNGFVPSFLSDSDSSGDEDSDTVKTVPYEQSQNSPALISPKLQREVITDKTDLEEEHKTFLPAAFTSKAVINKDSTASMSSSLHMIKPSTQKDVEPIGPDKLIEVSDTHFDLNERKKNEVRNKKDEKRFNAMALLKMKRDNKQKREEEEAKQKVQKKVEAKEVDGFTASNTSINLKSSEVYSSGSEREERFVYNQNSRSSDHSGSVKNYHSTSYNSYNRPRFISTVDHMNKLRISRHKLEKFINLPTFEKTVIGCFVRISIGNNNSSQKTVYRVAEITAVLETPKVYLFGNSRTNKGVRLRHGTQERVFRLEFVSNQDFTVTEFDKWKEVCHRYSVVFPQIDLIEQKKKDIQLAMSYEFREEDVNRIIQEKDRFRAHPTNYAMKKTHLMKERDAAQLRGEDDLANDITSQIQELEERANELDKRRTSSISLISYINNRNRKMNVEEAEKAIIEEAKANQGKKFSDPFTRRSTKPKMAFKAFAPNDDEDLMMAPEAPKIHKSKEKKQEEHTSADNLYSLHDFEIELDVTLPMNNVPILPKPIEQKTNSGPIKRSLNLEDYKKKRGLI